MKRRRLLDSLESSSRQPTHRENHRRAADNASSPSSEVSHDAAPTKNAPENHGPKAQEKSRFEASEPYRAKKGDRFS